MNNNFNNLPPDISNQLRQKGIDPKNIKKADADKLLNNISKEDAQKINALLNDKAALEAFLNSDKAKNLMKQLFGEK